MLENQLGRNLSAIGQAAEAPGQPKEEDDPGDTSAGGSKFPEVGRAVEEALDLLKYDGEVNDSLAEMRKNGAKGFRCCMKPDSTRSGCNMPAARTKRDLRQSGRS